jgi:hypothetical protein
MWVADGPDDEDEPADSWPAGGLGINSMPSLTLTGHWDGGVSQLGPQVEHITLVPKCRRFCGVDFYPETTVFEAEVWWSCSNQTAHGSFDPTSRICQTNVVGEVSAEARLHPVGVSTTQPAERWRRVGYWLLEKCSGRRGWDL